MEATVTIACLAYVFLAAIAWQLVYRLASWRLGGGFIGGKVENQLLWTTTAVAWGLPIVFCTKDWRDPLSMMIRAAVTGKGPEERPDYLIPRYK